MIVGCSPEEHTCRQLNMSWGIIPVHIKEEYSMEILLLHATEAAERAGYVEKGDIVVLTAGVPLGRSGNTNLIKATVAVSYTHLDVYKRQVGKKPDREGALAVFYFVLPGR